MMTDLSFKLDSVCIVMIKLSSILFINFYSLIMLTYFQLKQEITYPLQEYLVRELDIQSLGTNNCHRILISVDHRSKRLHQR